MPLRPATVRAAETTITTETSRSDAGGTPSEGDTDPAEESEDESDERDERDERERDALHTFAAPLHDWIPVRILSAVDELHTHAPPESAFTARLERPPRAA